MEPDTETKLYSFIRENLYLSISDISNELGISRNTVSKHLEIMMAKNKINYRQVGRAKIWYITPLKNKEKLSPKIRKQGIHIIKEMEDFMPYGRFLGGPTITKLREALDALKKEMEEG